MSKENEFRESDLPRDIAEAADAALAEVIPEKSKDNYEKVYNAYQEWKIRKGITVTCEKVLFAYFKEQSEKYKPTTLWSQFSKLKCMINLKEKINVDKFAEMTAFLKQKSRGYNPKKSKVFSSQQIQNFLENAPNEHDLDKKVIILFGIFGAFRGGELTNVTIKDIERQGSLYCVKVPTTKTMKPRSFVIPGEYCSLIDKYIKLRPTRVTTDRFFLNYQKGKCTVQVIGKNKIAAVPQKVAEFLNLTDPENYTGHSFRRTSATMLVDAGADLMMLKRHGGWKSSAVAEGYVEESMANKKEIGSLFSKMIDMPSTSASVQMSVETTAGPSKILPNEMLKDKNFNFTNCNITFNLK